MLADFQICISVPLTLASDMAVLYGNDVFSIFVLSTKKRYSSFLKNVFNIKVLKTFQFSTDCHIHMPISQTEGYFENPKYGCLEERRLFLLALK